MAITTPSSSLSFFSFTSSHHHSLLPFTTSFPKPPKPISLSLSSPRPTIPIPNAHIETTFFSSSDPEDQDAVFDPPVPPEGFLPPPSFDDEPPEKEEQIARAYEELYGPAYSGVSVLGNDVYVMDSKVRKVGAFGKVKKEKIRDGFEERVVEAKEVIDGVQKAAVNARRNIVNVPMTKHLTFPHRSEGDYGAAKVMLRPASPGTGVIAGGATVVAVQKMRQFREVALDRGIPMEELWK
ncbi:hypothetical protein ACLB2K_032787 [Fragaria x ananassa]